MRYGFLSCLIFAAVIGTFVGVPNCAYAQGPKSIVVSAAAGGNLDRIARVLAGNAELKSAWAGYIVIDNQVGSFGLKAVEYSRSLPQDGGALLLANMRESGGSPEIDHARALAGLADFVPIAYLGSVTSPNGKVWYGAFGSPGMSRESARKLEAAIQQGMRSSEMATAIANIKGYQQDRAINASALAQALGVSLSASPSGSAAVSGANAPNDPSKLVAGQGISLRRLAGGAGLWPEGVEPGNLYIVKYRLTTDAFQSENVMLISARSKAEAEQSYERAWNTMRDEALKPLYDQSKLAGQGGAAGRANLAVHSPRYKLDYRVTQECLGANWGAVVTISFERSFYFGAACGARTPAEAITAAFEFCRSQSGYNCNREGTRTPTPIITLAHSGARPWVEPIDKPRLGSSWPPATFQFTALSATTYQMHASTLDYVQGPNEAIASFGKACGKKAHARDIYACWISSRSMPCILNSPINPQDKMPMQQACIDVRLTKDGYLP